MLDRCWNRNDRVWGYIQSKNHGTALTNDKSRTISQTIRSEQETTPGHAWTPDNSSGQSTKAPNAPFEGPEETLKEILKNLRLENVMSMLQAYETLFRDMRQPSQIPEVMENVVKPQTWFESLSRGTGIGNSVASNSETGTTTNKDQTAPQDPTSRPGTQGPDCR
ncbi:hypothetical protein R1sor_009047 [Riccia sorocarpa]|uniref:Uncharacterized protein n=1 Tax=Riccia sorocarpa TaxID=122646 RepID=A0ABD3H4W5_9MARC